MTIDKYEVLYFHRSYQNHLSAIPLYELILNCLGAQKYRSFELVYGLYITVRVCVNMRVLIRTMAATDIDNLVGL